MRMVNTTILIVFGQNSERVLFSNLLPFIVTLNSTCPRLTTDHKKISYFICFFVFFYDKYGIQTFNFVLYFVAIIVVLQRVLKPLKAGLTDTL